ncbi:MAG: endonuclease VIII, partial [Lachnospiraceae bacterium]|nr:endonuclease VIII [Lachnospiraceae bacterium]
PFSDGFEAHYRSKLLEAKPNLSAKAFLATEQRFPGIGNGSLQDILFEAGIHPKRKIKTLSKIEEDKLYSSIISVLKKMTELGGRNTEKDLFGNKGGYEVKLSKNTLSSGCSLCGGQIVKETYMGGSIYYCPACQPV